MLLQRVLALSDGALKISKLTEIARILVLLGQRSLVAELIDDNLIDFESIGDVEQKAMAQIKMAGLVSALGDVEKGQYYIEKTFITIVSQKDKNTESRLYLDILEDLESIGDYRNTKTYWKRLIAGCKREPVENLQEQLICNIAIAMARLTEWKVCFKLVQHARKLQG